MSNVKYNTAFEKVILSSFIFQPDLVERHAHSLKPEDFYLPSYANIFKIIMDLEAENKPIDEEFIKGRLLAAKIYDEVVLLDVLTATPVANIEPYISEIKKLAQFRALHNMGVKLISEEFNEVTEAINYAETTTKSIIDMNLSADDFGISSLIDAPDGETEFILKEWLPLPRGTVSLVVAPGGTGKSWTALQMAIRHSRNSHHKSVVWLSEDPIYESKKRAKSICADILHSVFDVRGVDVVNKTPIQLIQNKKFSHSNFYKIRKNFAGYDLVVIDPLLAFYGGDENDNSQARTFMQPFMDWASEENICIVFLHHSKKNKDDSMRSSARGAGAFVDAARTVYQIDKIYTNKHTGALDMDNAHMREFMLTKDNYGVIRLLNDYKVQREITPKKSARVVETAYQYETTKMEMPEI